jgi:tetratricopeptide (TPR) repeat protein
MIDASEIVIAQFSVGAIAAVLGVTYIFFAGSRRGAQALRIIAIPVTLLFLSTIVWGKYYASKRTSISIDDIASNPTKAIEDLTQVLRVDRLSSTAYFKRGVAYSKLNEPQRAYFDLQNASELSPSNREVTLELAKAVVAVGDGQRARTLINRVLTTDPKNFDALNALGIVESKAKNYSDALKDFESALVVAGDDEQRFIAHVNSSIALAAEQRWDDALVHLKAALELRPNDAEVLAGLANTYGQKAYRGAGVQFHQLALDTANHALSIDPRSTLAAMTRAGALFYLGQREEGLKELTDLVNQHPDNAELRLLRAQMYTVAHEDEPARLDLVQAQSLISSSGTTSMMRALQR